MSLLFMQLAVAAYVCQDLRVERAVHLLQTSADSVSLRNLLRRKLGRGVRELRARN